MIGTLNVHGVRSVSVTEKTHTGTTNVKDFRTTSLWIRTEDEAIEIVLYSDGSLGVKVLDKEDDDETVNLQPDSNAPVFGVGCPAEPEDKPNV